MAAWFATLVVMIPAKGVAADLPTLGLAKATDVNGQLVETAAAFSGGFSVEGGAFLSEGNINVEKNLNIVGEITVDPAHVGQVADIVVYVSYATFDDPANPLIFMIGNNWANILPWNFDLTELVPFTEQVELQATHRIDIFTGPLLEGKLAFFFGYLTTDALIVNRQPIEMILEAIPEIKEPEEPPTLSEEPQAIDTTPMLIPEDDKFVGEKAKRWPNGTTLKVGFDFDGADFNGYWPQVCSRGLSPDACGNVVADYVIKYASEWSQYGNIYFTRAAWNEANIRIRFREEGSYSYVGTDATKYPTADQHTMNLAFSFWREPKNMKGTTMHEFGHALGLYHEHNSPNVAYNWDEAQVIADVSRHGWSENKIRANILNNLLASGKPRSAFFLTTFDPQSIMIYPIPKRWVSAADQADPERCPDTTSRYYCVAKNYELSDMDKQGIAQFYPRREQQSNGCSMQYDPSRYQSGTYQGDGQIGYIGFYNPTSSSVEVKLYHPDYPGYPLKQKISSRWNVWIYAWSWYQNVRVKLGANWGIQVNDSPICFVGAVSDWKSSYFQASTTRMPGM
jgi:hypothetical protein